MKEAYLYEKLGDKKVKCFLCPHRCEIAEGKKGICNVRLNKDGTLYTLTYERLVAKNIDPIEKKPLFHFLPGSMAFSVATMGCNFKCPFCQNWQISQADGGMPDLPGEKVSPADIVLMAKESGCKSISYTYTEPTIFFEYAYDTAKIATEKGLKNSFVTNGFMTGEALDKIRPYLDAANVDLKAFSDETYRKVMKGRLEPVLQTIQKMKSYGIWVEVTTLVVPGMNDSEEEIRQIARSIASVSKDIPWHISRFYPQFKETKKQATPVETIRRAREIGLAAGLKYVYVGNVAGEDGENTFCPSCKKKVIERMGYQIFKYYVKDSKCEFCEEEIDGVGM